MSGRTWVLTVIAASALGAGCPGRHGGGSETAEPVDPSVAEDRAFLARLDEAARQGGVVETIHGVEVADPYRSLEEDGPETRAWIDAQTERSARLLGAHESPALRSRLDALMSIGLLGRPFVGGERVFALRRSADEEQASLLVRDGPDAGPRVLLDPTAEGERVSIDWYFPTPDGRLVAAGLSTSGDERSVLRVLDAATAEERGERIEHCKWSTVAWLPDGSGFYYTRYPREGEEGYRAEEPDSYFPRVFFHRLGEEPARDALVYGADEPDDFPWPSVSEDGRWLVVNVMRGWSRQDVYVLDREADEPVLTAVREGCDCLVTGSVAAGRLWLLTNEGHPRYRILAAPPEEAARPEAFREVVPESDATIDGFDVGRDRLVVHDLHRFASRLRLFDLEGAALGELALPAEGSVLGLSAGAGSSRLAVVWSSFFYPPALFTADLDAEAPRLEEVERIPAEVDVSRYVVRRETVPSADGTPINVFLVHDRDARGDGSNRVLLYGYGGFNVSILPSFTRRALLWLEGGGTYAVANLRGGGELGEDWHRAGMLENKPRVFEDFEAVIRWLSSSGWSAPPRIAILGGSNGGLLVGATLARCPEAFGAAIGSVGLYDMVRYDRFPPAELWVSEYGTASDPEQFRYLHDYSPYHRLEAGRDYPAALIETADHDTRVHWGHSTKFAARLQELSSRPERVLFYMDRSVGHGAGTGRSDLVDQTLRLYEFLDMTVGLGEGPTASVEAAP